MDDGRPKSKLWFKELRDITWCSGCGITASESFWITGKFSKVIVIVYIHSIGLGMRMKLVIPLSNTRGAVYFGSGLGTSRDECLLLFVVPFGEVVDITGMIDQAMWAVHIMVHALYIAYSMEFSAILFGEDEIWLKGLLVLGLYIRREQCRVDDGACELVLISSKRLSWCASLWQYKVEYPLYYLFRSRGTRLCSSSSWSAWNQCKRGW